MTFWVSLTYMVSGFVFVFKILKISRAFQWFTAPIGLLPFPLPLCARRAPPVPHMVAPEPPFEPPSLNYLLPPLPNPYKGLNGPREVSQGGAGKGLISPDKLLSKLIWPWESFQGILQDQNYFHNNTYYIIICVAFKTLTFSGVFQRLLMCGKGIITGIWASVFLFYDFSQFEFLIW